MALDQSERQAAYHLPNRYVTKWITFKVSYSNDPINHMGRLSYVLHAICFSVVVITLLIYIRSDVSKHYRRLLVLWKGTCAPKAQKPVTLP